MATNGYATLLEVKSWMGIPTADTTEDTLLDARIDAASRWIDYHCRRHFYLSSAETRVFTAYEGAALLVDDLDALTTLKTDEDGDGTFETTWASTDYRLEPHGKKVNGLYRPYNTIHKAPAGTQRFPLEIQCVQVIGNFGWSSVPHPVRDACLILVTRLHKRKDAAFQSLGGDPFDPQAVPIRDADVEQILRPFVNGPVVG